MTKLQSPRHDKKPKFNVIKGQLQNLRTLKTTNFMVVIRDGYAVASFDDPSFAKKMVRQEESAGNKNVRYHAHLNSAIEKYPDKSRQEITKIITKKLKESGANITSQ